MSLFDLFGKRQNGHLCKIILLDSTTLSLKGPHSICRKDWGSHIELVASLTKIPDWFCSTSVLVQGATQVVVVGHQNMDPESLRKTYITLEPKRVKRSSQMSCEDVIQTSTEVKMADVKVQALSRSQCLLEVKVPFKFSTLVHLKLNDGKQNASKPQID